MNRSVRNIFFLLTKSIRYRVDKRRENTVIVEEIYVFDMQLKHHVGTYTV